MRTLRPRRLPPARFWLVNVPTFCVLFTPPTAWAVLILGLPGSTDQAAAAADATRSRQFWGGIVANGYAQGSAAGWPGAIPATAAGVYAFMGPTVSVTIAAGNTIHVHGVAAMGSTAAGGATLSFDGYSEYGYYEYYEPASARFLSANPTIGGLDSAPLSGLVPDDSPARTMLM